MDKLQLKIFSHSIMALMLAIILITGCVLLWRHRKKISKWQAVIFVLICVLHLADRLFFINTYVYMCHIFHNAEAVWTMAHMIDAVQEWIYIITVVLIVVFAYLCNRKKRDNPDVKIP